MKNKNISILFFSIFISIFVLEMSLRNFGFNKFTLYYVSNYYGYYHLPNQNFLSRFDKSISLDNIGNRNPKENNVENSEIFFLGDSVTYGGSIVANDELFSSLVSKKLGKKYLNISSNGWGIPNILNFIEYNEIYKKNSTYILTCISDCFTRNLRKIEQNFFFQTKSSFAIINFLKLVIFKLNENISFSEKSSKVYEFKDNIKTIDYSINRLKLLNNYLKKINSNLIFVYSPNLDDLKSALDKSSYENQKYKNHIIENISKSNIEFVDILDYFDQKTINNFKRFYVDYVHLSKEGHKLYSEILVEIIND